MRRRKTERYGAVERTFEIKLNKPAKGLKAVKVIIVILLAAIVLGLVFVGSRLYFSNDSKTVKTSETEAFADTDLNDELLRIVNKSNPLEKDYVPELVERDGYSISPLAAEELDSLLEAAGKDGIELSVSSAYVSYDEQNKLYTKKYKYNRKRYNLTEVRAQAKTETVIPQAGNSEAQTGLLVTFRTKGKFAGSKASRWLMNNGVDYGFVERYAADKTESTSMKANPSVYRFVGKDNAHMMRSLNKSLNEYVLYINSR